MLSCEIGNKVLLLKNRGLNEKLSNRNESFAYFSTFKPHLIYKQSINIQIPKIIQHTNSENNKDKNT